MALMFGDTDGAQSTTNGTILKTWRVYDGKKPSAYTVNGQTVTPTNVKYYKEDGSAIQEADASTASDIAFVTGEITVTSMTIDINAETFPGTYYITGDTYARSEDTGEDEFFQFVITKAKVQSEITLTMEAEGDPSTFSMNLKVLRPKSGPMMQLIKYDLGNG